MPLPAAVAREQLHFRHIELRGFRRVDGLYDIEARLVDTKTEEIALPSGRTIPQGAPLHDMSIRLVVDESLEVRDIVAATDAAPYGVCRDATQTSQCANGWEGRVDAHISRNCSARLQRSHFKRSGLCVRTILSRPTQLAAQSKRIVALLMLQSALVYVWVRGRQCPLNFSGQLYQLRCANLQVSALQRRPSQTNKSNFDQQKPPSRIINLRMGFGILRSEPSPDGASILHAY
jgi:hypothetical protein